VVFFLRAGVSPWNYYTLSEGGRDGWGCRKSLGVCSYYLFLARNIIILQKNRKTEKTHQVFKKFTCRTSKDPRQKISLMYHIFFYSPLAKQKGVGSTLPLSPGLRIHLLFSPHPWGGGTWPRVFSLLTMGIRPAWHLIQKNSSKTRRLVRGWNTKKHSSKTSYNFLVLGCVIPVSPR
jgi:hypothetical protein